MWTMTKTVEIPTLEELRAAGYVIKIKHNRPTKFAYVDPKSKKIVVKVVVNDPNNNLDYPRFSLEFLDPIVSELLPKGGKTEIWVTDPTTSAEFYGYSRCHSEDTYEKRIGINKAIERVVQLMLVMDGKEGFKIRF